MAQAALKDFFGTPAMDYGSYTDMKTKYKNNIFIFVTNDPPPLNDNGYILEIGDPDDRDSMEDRAFEYYTKMRKAGHTMCGAGIVRGWGLVEEALNSFIGGVGV